MKFAITVLFVANLLLQRARNTACNTHAVLVGGPNSGVRELECRGQYGADVATESWYLDGQMIDTTAGKYNLSADKTRLLFPSEPSVEGKYQCQGNTSGNTGDVVRVPPMLKPPNTTIITRSAGETFTIPFPIEVGKITREYIDRGGTENPCVQWRIVNSQTSHTIISTQNPDVDPKRYRFDSTTWALTVLEPGVQFKRNYTSAIVQIDQPVELTWEITVHKPLQVSVSESNVVRDIGESAVFICTSILPLPMKSSNPNVAWTLNGKPLDGDRISRNISRGNTSITFQLTVASLSVEDAGPVTCTVSDVVNGKFLTEQGTSNLTVLPRLRVVESYLSVQPHHCQNGTLTVITNTQVPPNATLHVGQLSYKSSAVCSGNRCSVTNLDVTPYSKSQLNMSFFIRGDTREEWGRPLPDLKDCNPEEKTFEFYLEGFCPPEQHLEEHFRADLQPVLSGSCHTSAFICNEVELVKLSCANQSNHGVLTCTLRGVNVSAQIQASCNVIKSKQIDRVKITSCHVPSRMPMQLIMILAIIIGGLVVVTLVMAALLAWKTIGKKVDTDPENQPPPPPPDNEGAILRHVELPQLQYHQQGPQLPHVPDLSPPSLDDGSCTLQMMPQSPHHPVCPPSLPSTGLPSYTSRGAHSRGSSEGYASLGISYGHSHASSQCQHCCCQRYDSGIGIFPPLRVPNYPQQTAPIDTQVLVRGHEHLSTHPSNPSTNGNIVSGRVAVVQSQWC